MITKGFINQKLNVLNQLKKIILSFKFYIWFILNENLRTKISWIPKFSILRIKRTIKLIILEIDYNLNHKYFSIQINRDNNFQFIYLSAF